MGFQLPLFIAPLAAALLSLAAVRMSTYRTAGTRVGRRRRVSVGDVVITAAAVALFSVSGLTREATFYVLVVPLALVAAAIGRWNIVRTMHHVVENYLNPDDWTDLRQRGPRWRYEMKSDYLRDPEFVDLVTLDLIDTHPTYADFRDAVVAQQFPPRYEPILDKRLWGFVLPTTRSLLRNAVIKEVFENSGRYRNPYPSESIYHELRGLRNNRSLLLDRWQYYWTLRNLNYLANIFRRVFSSVAEITFVLLFAAGFAVLDTEFGPDHGAATWLRAIAAASILWVVVICGGTNLLLVQIFRGTGTFAIDVPLADERQDPLWPRFVRLGIYAFAASFMFYGVGMPLLLTPKVFEHFMLSRHFVALSAFSFLLCAVVFLNHIRAIHELMRSSRNNGMDRAREQMLIARSRSARRAGGAGRPALRG